MYILLDCIKHKCRDSYVMYSVYTYSKRLRFGVGDWGNMKDGCGGGGGTKRKEHKKEK